MREIDSRATLITGQLEVNVWHASLDDPAVADAILDRIVHSSHRIGLKGPSARTEDGTTSQEQTNRHERFAKTFWAFYKANVERHTGRGHGHLRPCSTPKILNA